MSHGDMVKPAKLSEQQEKYDVRKTEKQGPNQTHDYKEAKLIKKSQRFRDNNHCRSISAKRTGILLHTKEKNIPRSSKD